MTTSRSRRWCPKKPVTCRNGTISKQRPRACSLPPRSVVAGNIFTADYSPPVRYRSFRCLSIRRIRDLSRLLVASPVYILCRLHKPPSPQTPRYHCRVYKIIIGRYILVHNGRELHNYVYYTRILLVLYGEYI